MTDYKDQQERNDSTRPPKFQAVIDAFIAAIPSRHIVKLGNLLGTLIYYVDVPHRRIVRRNLMFVHPDWSPNRINFFSKRIFQNVAVTFMEIIQMASLSCEEIMGKIKLKVEPMPSPLLSAQILPPCSSTMLFVIERPRPVP